MREKVVPIPFLGQGVSAWLYRTSRWVRANRVKASAIVVTCCVGSIIYESQVTHKNRMISPNVKNHLEYSLKNQETLWRRVWPYASSEADREDGQHVTVEAETSSSDVVTISQLEKSRRSAEDAERLLAETTDPEKRATLQKIIDAEKEFMSGVHGTTMVVRKGQLAVRAPHWELRNHERNWNILARDQQQQKDHYWYRRERSKDDDFARNTYMK